MTNVGMVLAKLAKILGIIGSSLPPLTLKRPRIATYFLIFMKFFRKSKKSLSTRYKLKISLENEIKSLGINGNYLSNKTFLYVHSLGLVNYGKDSDSSPSLSKGGGTILKLFIKKKRGVPITLALIYTYYGQCIEIMCKKSLFFDLNVKKACMPKLIQIILQNFIFIKFEIDNVGRVF